eukprot:TRINITY_DN11643_c0_g1_i4.p1 TRINITY_DN11643_c0_g1~~TRINITY_DN11643_c0_g1_i4.p1  ORF type:complete len:358 (+),score=19.42 TRINITY_DN11643_c0_g1_i4:501-1574(+)
MAEVAGIALSFASAFTTGSFTVPFLFDSVKRLNTDPSMFNFYLCMGNGLIQCLTPLFGVPLSFTWLGILSGFLLVVSSLFRLRCVEYIGVSAGMGVSNGVGVLSGFLFGLLTTPVTNAAFAVIGITLLVVSICGLSYAQSGSSTKVIDAEALQIEPPVKEDSVKPSTETDTRSDHSPGTFASSSSVEGSYTLLASQDDVPPEPNTWRANFAGILYGVVSGIFAGLVFAPAAYASSDASHLAFLFSFAIGILVWAPLIAASEWAYEKKVPELHLIPCLPLAFLSGAISFFSNVFSIVAIADVGYAVAMPIRQGCGVLVASLWGVLLFNEMKGAWRKALFWSSNAVLLGGAVCIALSIQ